MPESVCKGFLKISCGICFLTIIISSPSFHHYLMILSSSSSSLSLSLSLFLSSFLFSLSLSRSSFQMRLQRQVAHLQPPLFCSHLDGTIFSAQFWLLSSADVGPRQLHPVVMERGTLSVQRTDVVCVHLHLMERTDTLFFSLRLPIGQYGPVSQLSRSEESCTGPFNWGEAHCAGEKVKRKIGPLLRKSLKNQTRTRTQQKGRSPPRQPGTPWPGSQVHGPTRKQTQQARDFTNKS